MSVRNGSMRQAVVVWVAAAFILSLAGGVGAQGPPVPDLERLAWLGCWELEAEVVGDSQEPLEGQRLVCLSPGDRPHSLELTSIVDGRIVLEQALVTDGSKQPVDDGGCSGWERTMLSADGHRVYQQSETTCAGGNARKMTGAAVMLSGQRWVDIQVVRTDEQREIMIRRYRQATNESASAAQGVELGTLRTAVHTARLQAGNALTPDDVIEALDRVDTAVVEAMLLETEASFDMDSRLLLRLDDAGVPGQIIDLMVALSFPEYFAINDEEEPASSPGVTSARSRALYGYGYGSYYTPWFSPFGYGYYYPQPSIIVLPGTRFGGKVVKGRGYTRVRATQLPAGGLAGLLRSGNRSKGGGKSGTATRADGGSDRGGGAVSKSGHTQGKSGSKRKAKRRSGNS